jgi:hypothetical protein
MLWVCPDTEVFGLSTLDVERLFGAHDEVNVDKRDVIEMVMIKTESIIFLEGLIMNYINIVLNHIWVVLHAVAG